jgi:hypothetical protein
MTGVHRPQTADDELRRLPRQRSGVATSNPIPPPAIC